MKALRLRSNEFSGDIPLQICQLSSLMVLDVANNRLSGTIPHCLNNITAMVLNNASQSVQFMITTTGVQFILLTFLTIICREKYLWKYSGSLHYNP